MIRDISRTNSMKVGLASLYVCHALAYTATATKLPLEPSWLRLRGWMEARGASGTDGIDVGVVNVVSGLRGVIARKAFAQGDEVLSVPLDCILSESWADNSPIREVYDKFVNGNPEQLPACVRVALLLLWLQHSEPEEWAPYFSMLPMYESFTGGGGEPLDLWSPEEVHACGCPILEAQVTADRTALRYIYDEVVAPGWAAASAKHLNRAHVPSFADFQRAVVTVNSRAYGEDAPFLPDDDDDEDSGDSDDEATMSLKDLSTTCLLVPAVDLCNHECASKVNAVKGLAPWGHFVVVADRAIEVGDEIFLSYGQMPSRFLMAQFGFVLQPSNDQNELEFDQPTVKFLVLSSSSSSPAKSVIFGGSSHGDGFSNDLDPAMLEELCDAGLLMRSADGTCNTHQVGGPLLEKACAKLQVDYGRLLSAQRSASDSEKSDSVSATSSPRQRLASEYRKAQVKLLELEKARVRRNYDQES